MIVSDGENTIDGYQLTNNLIAAGNASEIWEVVDPSGGAQPLCMKLLLPAAMENADAKAILKHEAKVAKALDHPNIIKVHKISVTKKHAYLLMDYFRAPNLKAQLSNDRTGLHSRFRKVFEAICLALGYMHEKGWVHRDIKPDNILANKVGELRLIDFSLSVKSAGGLAKLLGSGSKVVQGTRTYIAPETLLKKPSTTQTDMYSLGITIFEVLTGNPPFRGMSPAELLRMHVQEPAPNMSFYNDNITPEMDRLVARLLAKKPANRHKNMEEVYAEFRSLKVFKEDPKDVEARRLEEEKRAQLDSIGASERVSSRRDHQRSEAGLNPTPAPVQPKPAAKPAPKQPAPQPAARTQSPPQGTPQPGQGYPQQGMPPGMPYPNYPPGSYGFPPGMQPPPGYPMPQGYPPGMQPPPGYPMPPGMPNQPAPQQPPAAAPPQAQPQQPSAPQPQQPTATPKPAASAPPAAAPKPAAQTPPAKPQTEKKKQDEDLELMQDFELPDVL